jgi:hypothetical protein
VSSILCAPSACPHDDAFEHNNYFGCVPRDFSPTTGRSKSRRQREGEDGRWQWDGGCDLAEVER